MTTSETSSSPRLPKNMGHVPTGYITSDDGDLVVVHPDWTDAEVLEMWESTLSLEPPLDPKIERHVLYGYDAQQCRDLGVEPGTWWGDDGHRKTWIMVADVTGEWQ